MSSSCKWSNCNRGAPFLMHDQALYYSWLPRLAPNMSRKPAQGVGQNCSSKIAFYECSLCNALYTAAALCRSLLSVDTATVTINRNPMGSLSLYINLYVATETLFSQNLDYVIVSHKLILLDAGRERDARAACHPENANVVVLACRPIHLATPCCNSRENSDSGT